MVILSPKWLKSNYRDVTHLMARTANDGGEDGPRSVITGEARLY